MNEGSSDEEKMKRTLSESDSDDGEFDDQEQEPESEGKDMESGEASARKKRRGLIEKKRRDRINTCLAELRRLVPAAIERQGSAKLEKAEILQLTVEHLKAMKNAGTVGQGVSLMRTTDYRSVGFQRCMAETARFLYRMDTPEVNNSQKSQRNENHQSWTGQPTQKTAVGLTNVRPSLAGPQPPAQDARPSLNHNFTSPVPASKTNPTMETDGPPRHELNNKSSPSSNESAAHMSRQGLQFSFPFKHPAVLPIHAPDVMSFPLSFLSPAMTEWPFSVATKSNIKRTQPLFGPWSPQPFGSQSSNIAF